MWAYRNPVKVVFGTDSFDQLNSIIGSRKYALVTYPDAPFTELVKRLTQKTHNPDLVISDVSPNPDYELLNLQSARFREIPDSVDVIVALGGGSVIDSAKVFAAAGGDFSKVSYFLENKKGEETLSSIPIIAVPTTAGTGSEVTCWATVWNEVRRKKYSLANVRLYPEVAIVDPCLMRDKPYGLTLATGLDALSHALESIWNKNSNPISASYAVSSAKMILETLPRLLNDLSNLNHRSTQAEASLYAGLAFSNTKTAISHNISYPITLGWRVQHGIASSFSLPTVLRSIKGIGGFREVALKDIFGSDLDLGAKRLTRFLNSLGVGCTFLEQGVPQDKIESIIDEAFDGERGKNFIGTKPDFLESMAIQEGLVVGL